MRLLLPPALVFLLFGALMYLLHRFLPVGEFDFFGRTGLIWFLGVASVILFSMALLQFRLARTTIDPRLKKKSNKLITGGVFGFTRNPVYLSLLLLLLAWGLWLGNAFNTLLAALFVAYMNHFQIQPEEEHLERQFGKYYQQYCLKVRRWF